MGDIDIEDLADKWLTFVGEIPATTCGFESWVENGKIVTRIIESDEKKLVKEDGQ